MFEYAIMSDALEGMYVSTAALRTVNERFLDRLRRRQEHEFPVVGMIGDICLEELPSFGVFAEYGARISDALQSVRDIKSENPEFSDFVIVCLCWHIFIELSHSYTDMGSMVRDAVRDPTQL